MTIKLQGIYNQQVAKAVKELKTGDVIVWNYGYTSTVVDLIQIDNLINISRQDRKDNHLSSEKQSRWRCP